MPVKGRASSNLVLGTRSAERFRNRNSLRALRLHRHPPHFCYLCLRATELTHGSWCLLKGVQVQILFWAHGARRGFGIEILSALCVYIGTLPIFATFASAQQSLHTMARILGMGNALMDIITHIQSDATLDRLGLRKGAMHLVDIDTMRLALSLTKDCPRRTMAGGSAANTIRSIARLGVGGGFIGKIGHDRQGELVAQSLTTAGIRPLLRQSRARTGHALALVTPDIERTFATFLGAAGTLNTNDLSPSDFVGFDFFHIEGFIAQNHTLLERALAIAKSAQLHTSIDLGSSNIVDENHGFLRRVLPKYVDIIFANQDEARVFTGKSTDEALKEIAQLCSVAVVKLGPRGAIARRGDETAAASAIDVPCVDTTGCGDHFNAGFIYGLMHEWPLQQCLHFGCYMGACIIQSVGASMPETLWPQIRAHAESIAG